MYKTVGQHHFSDLKDEPLSLIPNLLDVLRKNDTWSQFYKTFYGRKKLERLFRQAFPGLPNLLAMPGALP
jgi:hypothetical protein